ncbi:hypothetical protein GIB67_008048, partial [Kingdonia uniflora]
MKDGMPDHDMHHESNVHANMAAMLHEGIGIGGTENMSNDEEPRDEDVMEFENVPKYFELLKEAESDLKHLDELLRRYPRASQHKVSRLQNEQFHTWSKITIATRMSLCHQKKRKPNGRKNGNKKVVEEEYRLLFQLEEKYLSKDKDDEDLVSESDEPLETDNVVGNLAQNGAMFSLTMLSWKVASNTSLDGVWISVK